MSNIKYNYTKSTSEKYTLRFNYGDYQTFTIDPDGVFISQGSYGTYSYHWTSFGENFKEFLIKLNKGYLFTKLCTQNFFDFDDYLSHCKSIIINERKKLEIDKEESRILFDFFTRKLEESNSLDYTVLQLYNTDVFSKVYGRNLAIHDTEFCPDYSYPHEQVYFITKVYPLFVDILKRELNTKGE